MGGGVSGGFRPFGVGADANANYNHGWHSSTANTTGSNISNSIGTSILNSVGKLLSQGILKLSTTPRVL